ncbi:hypothetical protein NDU88_005512 [Pleurodeles waltl]|uniref:Uncharacterized protein n=1 Tax=Pleurodeles waltl TaxID=8319 RepID=A0AAV7UI97_PLEWA|nr:hypothetical protein NDU88_005512 [Pleurodeles waltl]
MHRATCTRSIVPSPSPRVGCERGGLPPHRRPRISLGGKEPGPKIIYAWGRRGETGQQPGQVWTPEGLAEVGSGPRGPALRSVHRRGRLSRPIEKWSGGAEGQPR